MDKKVRSNPFEFLRINPGTDKQEIIEIGRELAFDSSSEEKIRIRQAVMDLTLHPLKRLEFQSFTYIDPNYNDSYWDKTKKDFLRLLTNRLRKQDHSYDLEYGLLYNLYNAVVKDSLFHKLESIINSNTNDNLFFQIWNNIFQHNINNYPLIHTLALLHQEWANEFEEQKNKELTSYHWEESRKHWFKLYPQEQFWNCFRDDNPDINIQQYKSFINNFPKLLLDIHRIRLLEHLQNKQNALAQIHFKCIKSAQKLYNKNLRSNSDEILENLTSKFLQEAKDKLNTGQLPEGIRENYESAIKHINILLELDPENKRALMFVVEKYNGWGFDLYTLDNKVSEMRIAEQSKAFAKKLAKQITKGQGYLRENQIVSENLLMQGYGHTDIKKSIALFNESLEYNPDYENAKKLITELQAQLQFEEIENIGKELKAGNLDLAKRLINNIPKNLPGFDTIMEQISIGLNNEGLRIADELNDLNKAVMYLEKAVELNPYDKMLNDNLNIIRKRIDDLPYENTFKAANEAWQNGNDDEVIRYLRTIPSSFIGYNEVKKFIALAYNRRSVNKLNSIMNSVPSQLPALSNNPYSVITIFNEAIKDFENALKYDPDNQQIKDNINSTNENLKAFEAISNQTSLYNYGYNNRKTTFTRSYKKKSRITDTIKGFLKGIFTSWWFWFFIIIWILQLIFK
jgi:hypothetical protein